ncbi:response regulator [Caldichromatium japonicum]|uniref:histidine kinase n=1 Tax=Caldichromatium japonicum TaxID=2699430 RepID=A0A6G7VDU9_9GAMM|nr:response regulator [Caldichromatium japonicum]QIK38132.1 response regulator [Caldichromatium japonicum]
MVVLHADPTPWLEDETASPWTAKSGEVLLIGGEGQRLMVLGQRPSLHTQPVCRYLSLTDPDSLAHWLQSAITSPGQIVEGRDDREQRVLGIALPVAETDWFLLAKMDHAELMAGFSQRAVWIFSGGGLLLVLAITVFSAWQQHQVLLTERQLAEEREASRRHLEELVEARTQALHHQSQALRALIDNLPHPVWMKDREGRFLAVNRTFASSIGQTPKALIGKTAWDLWPARVAVRYQDSDEWVIRNHQPLFLEERLGDDPDAVFEVFKAPIINAQGEIIGTVGFARDIRPERAIQEELARRAELAESAMRAKSAFLANMSYEIRTPMNAILGLTHLLKDDRQLTEDQLDKLDKIQTASQHLLIILDDILDLAKIESGKLQLAEDNFAVVPLLEKVCALVADAARAKGLSLTVDNQGVPDWLRGDAARIRQILLNYLSNAVKFTDQGSIVLRARVLDEDNTSVLVCFEVEDTGIGIPPDQLPELFQPFTQLDNSLSRCFGGTGLGLTINLQLANLMGGMVGAESQPDIGSIFWFQARFERGRSQQDPPAALLTEEQLRQQYSGHRLLLVEDDAVNREVIAELLRRGGIAVDQAVDGGQAIELVKESHYDVILMDIQMRVMDGLEATRCIRALPNGANIPILALTANSFDEDRAQYQAAGLNDCIAKPVSAERLLETIARWLPLRPAEAEMPTLPQPPTAALDADPDLARLRSVPGLDCAQGLSAVAGQAGRYLELLQRFAQTHLQDLQRIRTALETGDHEGIKALVHTLKGVAANLGATAVAEAAAAVNALLRSAPEISVEKLYAAIDRLEQTFASLTQVLSGRDSTSVPPLHSGQSSVTEQAKALCDNLIELLRFNDTRALALARQQRALLILILGESHAPFERHLGAFEFEEALELLENARLEQGIPS